MGSRLIFRNFRSPDLQGKVILILMAVIFPISIILGLAQSRVIEPVLYEEIRQVGLSFAQNIASQIEGERLLQKSNASNLIEDRIQRMVYFQPAIIRVDVISRRPDGTLRYLASSVEDQENATPPPDALGDQVSAQVIEEDHVPVWNITYPVRQGGERASIHILASLGFVSAFQSTILKINLIAAVLSTIVLILVLSFLLKRAIENERMLRVAQESNAALSGKLQEIQQALIQTEKLAVMGQLTASFAHEIGTPLNAVSGHIQLLKMNLDRMLGPESRAPMDDRLGIISSQLRKIEDIVKGFLATTKKPLAQERSRVPVRDLIRNVLALVQPSLQVNEIQWEENYQDGEARIEVVPVEIEQVILNLVNNAIYSLREKGGRGARKSLKITTHRDHGVVIEIYDTGLGISENHLKQIFKPFFTTKPAGEGHGLGLSICQQIIHAYGGELIAESKFGEWTRMRVRLPEGGKA